MGCYLSRKSSFPPPTLVLRSPELGEAGPCAGPQFLVCRMKGSGVVIPPAVCCVPLHAGLHGCRPCPLGAPGPHSRVSAAAVTVQAPSPESFESRYKRKMCSWLLQRFPSRDQVFLLKSTFTSLIAAGYVLTALRRFTHIRDSQSCGLVGMSRGWVGLQPRSLVECCLPSVSSASEGCTARITPHSLGGRVLYSACFTVCAFLVWVVLAGASYMHGTVTFWPSSRGLLVVTFSVRDFGLTFYALNFQIKFWKGNLKIFSENPN